MRSTYKLAIFSAIVVGALAVNGSIKQKLAEKAHKNLVEVEVESEGYDCECDEDCCPPPITAPGLEFCPEFSGSGLPPPQGAATDTTWNAAILATQGQVAQQVPNTASMTSCQGQCQACSAENEQSCRKATKNRNFCINGNICIKETVCESSIENEQEIAQGESFKSVACTTINQNGGSGTPPGTGEVCVSVGSC